MTEVVWKYVLQPGVTKLLLPAPATVLSAQVQGDQVCLWVQVNPARDETEPREFLTIPTGAALRVPRQTRFISTVQFDGGSLVFHVFEVMP